MCVFCSILSGKAVDDFTIKRVRAATRLAFGDEQLLTQRDTETGATLSYITWLEFESVQREDTPI